LVLAHVGILSFLWVWEGEYPGKLLDGNKYTNRFSKISEQSQGYGKGISMKTLGWKAVTGTSTGFQRSEKNSGLRKRNILENSGLENRDTNRVMEIFGKFWAGAR
jgi:hypothetical protein